MSGGSGANGLPTGTEAGWGDATASALPSGSSADGWGDATPAAAPAAAPSTLQLGAQGFLRGAADSGAATARTLSGSAFTDQPTPPAANDPLSQKLSETFLAGGGYKDPAWYAAHIGYGLGSSAPTLAGGALGAAAGEAVAPEAGPVGPIAGGAAGAFLGAATPAVAQNYTAARAAGLAPDAAATRALELAGVQGATAAAMTAAGGLGNMFEGSFMRTAEGGISHTPAMLPGGATASALTSIPGQALITQPAIGAIGQQAEGAVTGKKPTLEDYAAGYVANAATGGAMAALHGAPGRPAGRFEAAPEPATEAAPPGTPQIAGPPGAPPEAAAGALLPRSGPLGPPPAEPLPPAEPVLPSASGLPVTVSTPEPAVPAAGIPEPAPVPLAPEPPNAQVVPAAAAVPAPPPGEPSDGAGSADAPGGRLPGAPVGSPSPDPPVQPAQPVQPVSGGSGHGGAVQAAPGPSEAQPPRGVRGPEPGQSAAAPGQAQTVTTASGQKIQTKFEVVPAASLKPAGGELQPRDRSGRAASDAQITSIAASLDPSRLNVSPEADRGAPIVGPDHVVESGNGRVAAINQAYSAGNGAAYRQMITDQGHTIPPGMVNPILIRRRTSDIADADRPAYVRSMNVSATQSMSAPEQAQADAHALTHTMLGQYNPDLAGGPLAAGNRDFVTSWVKTLPESERNAVQDSSGALSSDGVRRLNGAMLARAYKDPGNLARSLESTDDNTKAITGAMVDAAPAWAKLQAGIEAGSIPKAMDVSRDLIRAADLVSQARARGQTAAHVIDQQDAFNPVNPVTEQFVRAMHNQTLSRAASRPAIADILRRYAQEAEKQSTSAGLFGADDRADPAKILEAVRQSSAAANDPSLTQGRLLAEQDDDAGYDDDGEHEDQAPGAGALADAPPAGFDPKVRGNIPHDVNMANRPSDWLRSTYADLGVADPEGMVSRPASVQVHILKAAVVDKYGLKQIKVSPKANPRETIDQLADAHHNLSYMAYAMGVPNSAIGFKGKLSLWLGPRDAPEVTMNGKQALGVYDPNNRTIYMPGRSNSFAHEWTHALDHQLVLDLSSAPNNIRKPLLSMSPAQWHAAPAGTSAGAFARVMASLFGRDPQTTLDYLHAQAEAMTAPSPAAKARLVATRRLFQATDFYRLARAASPDYLATPYELLARSHEAYISARVVAASGTTDFVTKPEIAYLTQADRVIAARYPKADERAAIFAAWDNLHDQLKADVLYPQGIPAVLPKMDLMGLGPAHWGQYMDPAANPGIVAAAKQQVRAQVVQMSAFEEGLHRIGINPNEGSDPGYLTKRVRAFDVMRAFTFSPRGMMNAIHTRVPSAAKAPTRKLIDMLTTDPGSGRYVPQTFEEDVHHGTRHDMNTYAQLAMQNHMVVDSLDRRAEMMTPLEQQQLHIMMTQQEDISKYPANIANAIRKNTIDKLSGSDQAYLRDATMQAAPPGTQKHIRTFAADLRWLLDKRHYELRQAGFDIPYVSGYFPRVMDDHKIFANPDAFEKDAVRALFIRSERETEADGELLADRFTEMKSTLDAATAAAIKQAISASRKGIRAAQTASGMGNQPAPPASAEDLIPDNSLRDAINQAWAVAKAHAWRQEIMVGSATGYDTRGPKADALKARVMPPESDAILREWMVIDPHAAIPNYLHQTRRKMAFAKRFEASGKIIDDLMTSAEAGGMKPQDVREMKRLANSITGRPRQSQAYPHALVRGLEYVHAFGTMALMPRAVFSALSEPMSVYAKTKSVRITYEGFAHIVRDAARTGSAQRIAEIANYLGIVSHSAFESVQADRTDATYTDSQKLGPMLINFFRRIGLTALTNSQRRAGVVSGSMWLHSLADTILKQGPIDGHAERRSMADAKAQLRNLGIPDNKHEQFAKWLSSYDNIPDIEALDGNENGELFGSAVARFVDQINQDPKTSEKPMVSTDPFGRLIYSLMGFNYGFQGNIIDAHFSDLHRQMHEEGNAGTGKTGKAAIIARFGLQTIGIVAAMWSASMIATVLREAMFNGTTWDEHKKKGDLGSWLASLAFQRTGLNGVLDPVMQAINGLKYKKSIATLALGAYPGYFTDNLTAVINPFLGQSSPNTNTAKYNAWVGAYNLAVPFASMALTMMPPGPVQNALGAAALMKFTSPGAADSFASMMVGPKGSEILKPGEHPARPGSRPAKPDKPAPSDGNATRNAAMNIADDFLPAMIKVAGKVPLYGKIAAAGLGAIIAGEQIAADHSRYKKPPSGADK